MFVRRVWSAPGRLVRASMSTAVSERSSAIVRLSATEQRRYNRGVAVSVANSLSPDPHLSLCLPRHESYPGLDLSCVPALRAFSSQRLYLVHGSRQVPECAQDAHSQVHLFRDSDRSPRGSDVFEVSRTSPSPLKPRPADRAEGLHR